MFEDTANLLLGETRGLRDGDTHCRTRLGFGQEKSDNFKRDFYTTTRSTLKRARRLGRRKIMCNRVLCFYV